jgi:hypothetical protein
LLRLKAGNAVDGFAAVLFAEDLGGIGFNPEDLTDMGKVKIAVEFGAGPDVTDFQPSVSFIGACVLRGEKRST